MGLTEDAVTVSWGCRCVLVWSGGSDGVLGLQMRARLEREQQEVTGVNTTFNPALRALSKRGGMAAGAAVANSCCA